MKPKETFKSSLLHAGEYERYAFKTELWQYTSSQEALTNIADLFRNVCSDIRDIPHCHERVKTGALLSFLDVRLVGEAEVMGNGCQKHLHTYDEILKETGQFARLYFR